MSFTGLSIYHNANLIKHVMISIRRVLKKPIVNLQHVIASTLVGSPSPNKRPIPKSKLRQLLVMGDTCVDLKLNRGLLDPHFDGYKLSLDPLAIYQKDCPSAADVVPLTENQYSYQHHKAYGSHNHLTADPWCQNTLYYVDKQWRIQRISMTENQFGEPVTVLQIPAATDQKLVTDRVSVTLHFTSSEWAVLADGAGVVFLIETGSRDEPHPWNVRHSCRPLGDGVPFMLRHSVLQTGVSNQKTLDCVLVHVEKRTSSEARDEEDGGPVDRGTAHIHFMTVIEWLTFTSNTVCGKEWELSRTRRLEGASSPQYVSLDNESSALYVASEKLFDFVHDSCVPVEKPKPSHTNGTENAESAPLYTWYQTEEDITVQIPLPPNKTRNDIIFKLSLDEIAVGCDPDMQFLDGQLYKTVDVESSTWTLIDGNKLEVLLEKVEKNVTWPVVVVGDTRGEMVVSEEQAALIHERLAHLTSEHWNPEEEKKPAYNTQQVEECDSFPDESHNMCRWHGETHRVTHKVNLGSHQWLFNCPYIPNFPPAICLRHDVDGIIWQPSCNIADLEASQAPFTHTATFNAFGYVQASKQQRKFTCCAPNHSFVAVCDCVRHIYVYRQPSAIDSPLRNRKTGRQVDSLAKQQLASLESVEDIVGCYASNNWLFALSGQKLYAIRINA